jgi:hypothetical protein
MAKKKKGQHGGARANSGRKASLVSPSKLIVNLETKQKQKLDVFCDKYHKTKCEVVRGLIDENLTVEENDDGVSKS